MKNIYLVGFMATGKTSVGKELSQRLHRQFFDLDDLIEQREGMRIVDIFKHKGEPYFRKLEKELVKDVSSKKNLIIGCGGGVVVDQENLANLRESGLIVCLEADMDTILKRSKGTDQRPLLNVKDPRKHISDLLKAREVFYNQADYKIDTTDLAINEVTDKVIAIIERPNTEQ